MILNDVKLREMFTELVGHDDVSLINPASIDLRVGWTLKTIEKFPISIDFHDGYFSKTNPYQLPPGSNMLVATMETVTIPNGYVGMIFLKSSRAREGYNHALALPRSEDSRTTSG